MWAVGIAIGIYLIWAYVLHGGGDTIGKLQQCGALTGNKGECKETCDSTLEAEFPDVGCKGVANKCCVARNQDMSDVMLPSSYGGNNNIDFEVQSITLNSVVNLNTCEKEDPTSDKSWICTPNNPVSLDIDILVKNTKSQTIEVYADPVVVINDNGDSIRGPGRYTGTVSSGPITAGNTAEVSTTVLISANDATNGFYIKVYPYAVCTTKECKVADSRGRGVMNRYIDDFISLRFIE